jgi:hypothetical protein
LPKNYKGFDISAWAARIGELVRQQQGLETVERKATYAGKSAEAILQELAAEAIATEDRTRITQRVGQALWAVKDRLQQEKT